MTHTHVVKKAKSTDDLEILLDNAANKDWLLVAIVPVIIQGDTSSFWVVFKKETNDD